MLENTVANASGPGNDMANTEKCFWRKKNICVNDNVNDNAYNVNDNVVDTSA